MKLRRAIVVNITPEERLKLFMVSGESIWRVKCRGLPADVRIAGITFDHETQVIRLCLETDDVLRFCEIPVGANPVNASIFEEIEFIGTCNSDSRSQRPTLCSYPPFEP